MGHTCGRVTSSLLCCNTGGGKYSAVYSIFILNIQLEEINIHFKMKNLKCAIFMYSIYLKKKSSSNISYLKWVLKPDYL